MCANIRYDDPASKLEIQLFIAALFRLVFQRLIVPFCFLFQISSITSFCRVSSYSSADLLDIDSFALSLKYGEQWPALIRFLPFSLFFSFFLICVQTVCEG